MQKQILEMIFMDSRLRGNDKPVKKASSFAGSFFLFIVIVGHDPTIQRFQTVSLRRVFIGPGVKNLTF
jgi:hypothetical protein